VALRRNVTVKLSSFSFASSASAPIFVRAYSDTGDFGEHSQSRSPLPLPCP
jgi:hypothetical protein